MRPPDIGALEADPVEPTGAALPTEASAAGTAPEQATVRNQPALTDRGRLGSLIARRRLGPPLELGPAVLAVLGTWFASRVAVVLVSVLGARAVGNPNAAAAPKLSPSGLLTLWNHWDVGLFVKVASFGYLSPAYADRTEVDLPGMPLAMRLVHPLVGDWVGAGLLVSFVAGLVASAALWRLAVDDGTDVRSGADLDRGRRAVLLLVCFPYAVFLFAGYSEALFLAFAATAWVAVRRQRWAWVGLLVAGATATRVLGVALLAAVWVEYLVTLLRTRHERPLRVRRVAGDVGWLLLPLAPLIAYGAYFQARTGHWDAYTRAMREHWGRGVTVPWDGLATTWRQAVNANQAASFQVFWWAELLAVAIGVVLTAVLLRRARWGEATYVGGCTAIMSCSSYWASGVRAVLVWFPLYLVLARRPRLLGPYLWVCAPAAAVFVLAFTSGVWVD